MSILAASLRGAKRFFVPAAVAMAVLSATSVFAVDAPQANVGRETLVGTSSPGLAKFMGIRYAQAPIGDLRWKPPAPAPAASGTVDATKPGSGCPQGKSPWGVPSSNEDCLFLNVTVPADGSGMQFWQRKPVMVFFYGGGFTGGSGDLYNADDLARENDVVVVTVNYRLGALGFFAHPALDAEDHAVANYGLLDQQQSLRWVRDNIASFGGNPDNVTIFGESAGAIAIYAHIVSPMAAGLFQKAIIESGAPADQTLQTAEDQGKTLAQKVGCPVDAGAEAAACLRKVPVDALVSAQATPIATIIDGKLLIGPIADALGAGHYNRVPVINGTNHDEGNLIAGFMFDLSGSPLVAKDYEKALQGIGSFIPRVGFADAAIPAISKTYALSKYKAPGLAAAQVITDGVIACPAFEINKVMAKYSPTFEYEMADTDARSIVAPPISFSYRAGHFSELQYLFDLTSITLKGTPDMTDAQKALGRQMRAYWANFARAGNPDGTGLPVWPRFDDGKAGPVQSLNKPTSRSINNFATEHQCAFWRTVERK
ncbi:carboxylesterase family protein [Rhizobium sp. BK376]|uniref:carboxylesterase/lipase family protein n=1 Tax=Rhizobium sp. BK376 TaxID=2512149 RepID=UPI001048CD48|nr:carboxylesterase family protein [Rhizobium sp. BK376]TCR74814.1 para-nitrobenzyl esterase [Rhizobium sp. BK376]